MDKAPKCLIQSQHDLLVSGNCSDCTVRCNGVEWKAHRCILCPRSAYFAKALTRNFQEGRISTVTMNDEEPYAIEGVLLYLYTFNYPTWPTWTTSPDTSQGASQQTNKSKRQLPETEWQTHLGMFKLADKLGLDGLKTEAQIQLQSAMNYECDASSFHELLGQLWEMEQLGVEAGQDAVETVLANATLFMATEEFRDELIRIPSFTARLAQELIQENIGFREEDKQLQKEIARARGRSSRGYEAVESVLDTWAVGQCSDAVNRSRVQSIYDKWGDDEE